MKDTFPLKNSLEPMGFLQPVLENGLMRINSDLSLPLVDIENTMPLMLRSYSVPNLNQTMWFSDHLELESSTPESLVKNKNQLVTSKDKLILSLKGIPITRSYQTSGLVSIIRGRALSPYWTESKGDLYQRLLLPNETDFVDSDLTWSNGSSSHKTHPSWFLVRTTKKKTLPLNSQKTSLPSQLCSSVNIMVEDDTAKTFLQNKNKENIQSTNRSVNRTIGKRLKGKITKKEQLTMTPEELDVYNQRMTEQKTEMLNSVKAEYDSVSRIRLFRVYGTKKQYEFLRQQRGICRHLYNLCLSDIRDHYNSNKFIIQHLQFLLDSDEIPLTDKEIKSIKHSIYTYTFLDETTLRQKYQPDAYWIDNNKTWGLLIPSNLRTMMIKNVLTNILVACKTSTGKFNMSFLSKKNDKSSFQIPVSTQQINVKTGQVFLSTRRRKQKTTKDVGFQYMSSKCPDSGIFKVRVSEKDKFPSSKTDIKHDCRFVYKSGCWYIGIVYDVSLNPTVDGEDLRICSIDIGIKAPCVVYDPQDGSITEIGTSKDSLERLKDKNKTLSTHARLERLRRQYNRVKSRLDKEKSTLSIKKRNAMNKCLCRLNTKKKNLINELHYKIIQYLTCNYDIIMMPYFDTEKMLKSKKLSKKSKQCLMDLNFSLFRQRLADKTESQGKVWLEVCEAYTTKSCVRCGCINNNMHLRQRTFECPSCGLILGRDTHSAISILVKNAELVLASS